MKTQFIITIMAEDRPGLVSQVVSMFNRGRYEIDSISAARTDIHAIVMITIDALLEAKDLNALLKKMQKVIEVYKTEAIEKTKGIYQKIAFFKLSKKILETSQGQIINKYGVQIINFHSETILIAKNGNDDIIREFYNKLDGPYLLGFFQSGLIADNKLLDDDEYRIMRSVA